MEWRNKEFWISDDAKIFLIRDLVQLYRQVYGSDTYPEHTIRYLIDNSFWLGLYKEKQLVGFVRAVTDRTTLSFICDFLIDAKFKRQGLGSWMMKCFTEHPDIRRTFIGLGTSHSHEFFQKFDFYEKYTMGRDPIPIKI